MTTLVCPTCRTFIDTEDRCPSRVGLGQCMELVGHEGWHWSDVGRGDGSIMRWTGMFVERRACPGRVSLGDWCKKPAGHDRAHNNGRGVSFGDPEPGHIEDHGVSQ